MGYIERLATLVLGHKGRPCLPGEVREFLALYVSLLLFLLFFDFFVSGFFLFLIACSPHAHKPALVPAFDSAMELDL